MAVTVDLDAIAAITDPVERHHAYLRAMDETRGLQAALASARGLTVYELYTRYGASSAAKKLGISRAGIYKIITQHAPPEVKEARRKALLDAGEFVFTAVAEASAAAEQQSKQRQAAVVAAARPKKQPPKGGNK